MKYELIDRNIIEFFVEKDKDLFLLFILIEKGDILCGYDFRIVKFNDKKEKKKVYMEIEVENIKFSQYGNSLRISGKVIKGFEEAIGHYHTFDISIGSSYKLIKKREITNKELSLLEKYRKIDKKIFIISLDNDEIAIGKLDDKKINIIFSESINISKIDPDRDSKIKNIYSSVWKIVEENKPDILIIVGPSFFPEIFYEYIKEKNKEINAYTFKVSNGGENGIYEFLRRKEYLDFLKDVEVIRVNNIIEDFISNIRYEKVVFGYDSVYSMLNIGNIEYILISFDYFKKMKEDNPEKISEIIRLSNKFNTEIYFVYEDNNYYELINRFGIVGKLRYNI